MAVGKEHTSRDSYVARCTLPSTLLPYLAKGISEPSATHPCSESEMHPRGRKGVFPSASYDKVSFFELSPLPWHSQVAANTAPAMAEVPTPGPQGAYSAVHRAPGGSSQFSLWASSTLVWDLIHHGYGLFHRGRFGGHRFRKSVRKRAPTQQHRKGTKGGKHSILLTKSTYSIDKQGAAKLAHTMSCDTYKVVRLVDSAHNSCPPTTLQVPC